MIGTITVVGLIVLAALIFFFIRARRQDQISDMMEKRRAGSRIVSKGELVSGRERIPVALALTEASFYYENPDLEANLDLPRLEEVEYDDELTTGHSVPQGTRALRLRSHGTAFEFILTVADATRWEQALPARRGDTPAARVG
ncbi:MAG TPA: hypothetical protein VNA04_09160 [Thermoanaerobaculia bacterium]|nr:hypothetical protein [Thermoanaerobaculia bacterium]